MIIQTKGDNLDITDHHTNLVYKLIEQKLEQYLATFNPDLKVADVRIKKRSRWGYMTNFSMVLPGKKQIYAEAVDTNLDTALRALRHKIERQLKSYRGKLGIGDKTQPGHKVALKSDSPLIQI